MLRNPIPYIGGKAALAPKLVGLLPPHHTYVEVFGGVAHVLFRKERSAIEVYNDTDGRLVGLLHVLRDHFDDFAARLRWTLYARSIYEAWCRLDPTGDPIADAIRTFFLLKTSMNANIGNSWYYSRLKPIAMSYERSKSQIEAVAARFLGVTIERKYFRDLIPRWDSPETMFFCDPPYYGSVGEQFWPFKAADHTDLSHILAKVQGKVMLTYHDHPQVRRRYRGWHVRRHHRARHTGQMWRLPARRVCELIITNYRLPTSH